MVIIMILCHHHQCNSTEWLTCNNILRGRGVITAQFIEPTNNTEVLNFRTCTLVSNLEEDLPNMDGRAITGLWVMVLAPILLLGPQPFSLQSKAMSPLIQLHTHIHTHSDTHTQTYRIAKNFDGYWLFKYLTENILTDGHCLSPTPVNAVLFLNNLTG